MGKSLLLGASMGISDVFLYDVVAVGPGFYSTSPAKSKRKNEEKLETLMEALSCLLPQLLVILLLNFEHGSFILLLPVTSSSSC